MVSIVGCSSRAPAAAVCPFQSLKPSEYEPKHCVCVLMIRYASHVVCMHVQAAHRIAPGCRGCPQNSLRCHVPLRVYIHTYIMLCKLIERRDVATALESLQLWAKRRHTFRHRAHISISVRGIGAACECTPVCRSFVCMLPCLRGHSRGMRYMQYVCACVCMYPCL